MSEDVAAPAPVKTGSELLDDLKNCCNEITTMIEAHDLEIESAMKHIEDHRNSIAGLTKQLARAKNAAAELEVKSSEPKTKKKSSSKPKKNNSKKKVKQLTHATGVNV